MRLSLVACLLGSLACLKPAPIGSANAPPPACCTLAGKWQLTIVLDSAQLWQGAPRDSTVAGPIEFNDRFRFFPHEPGEDTVRLEFGRHKLSFKPMWGEELAPEPSTAMLGQGTANPLAEVLGVVFAPDSVGIMLAPRFTHGGLVLAGAFSGDSLLTGRWALRGSRSRAAGHFTMRRTSGH